MGRIAIVFLSGLGVLAIVLVTMKWNGLVFSPVQAQENNPDPTHDWEVLPGFSVIVDSTGYTLPTAIATVPNPGTAPDDPLYFVTELSGIVKVVTNDRSVHVFAENFFELNPSDRSPFVTRQIGMAGICLDPDNGYVFVTFTYNETQTVLRNNVVRFDSIRGRFSLQPTSQLEFTEVFSSHVANPSHMIGPCQVDGGLLYVSVGDSFQSPHSRQDTSILGKVLRMTLDGKPAVDNPFRVDDDQAKGQNYVWAKGLRNAFGLWVGGGKVFAADNGPSVDRFLRVEESGDYMWDGTGSSFNSKAELLLSPNHGVVQMDRYPDGSDLFPEEFQKMFFLTVQGNLTGSPNPKDRQPPTILMIGYDLEQDRLISVAREFLRFGGDYEQLLVGLAFGRDGLYFAPFDTDPTGANGIYRVTYEPNDTDQPVLRKSIAPLELIIQKGCRSCHIIEGDGGTVGPNLERSELVARLREVLNSPAYALQIVEIDELDSEPFVDYRMARQGVLDAEGNDKVRKWISLRIQEPRFDRTFSAMPNLGIDSHEAAIIADFLVAGNTSQTGDPLRRMFDRLSGDRIGRRDLALFFVLGGTMGTLGATIIGVSIMWIVRRRKVPR